MATVDYKRELKDLIDIVVGENASDLHLSTGSHPIVRVTGSLIPLVKKPILTDEDVDGFARVLMSEQKYKDYLDTFEVDFSYSHADGVRFRGNGFFQTGRRAIALRLIPNRVRTLEELGLPTILESFTQRPQGFFLCVGPVGQGKSTTLAALIEMINETRADHIVTIEDPIEYVYEPKKSLIVQREVGVDTLSFEAALNSAFREDIDVILVGEMRNAVTIATAVTARSPRGNRIRSVFSLLDHLPVFFPSVLFQRYLEALLQPMSFS
jgi:twitching motility protein PilT